MQTPSFAIRCRVTAWTSLRETTGLKSDQALAERLGVSRSTVYQAMTGRDVRPNFIAAALYVFPFANFDRLFEPHKVTR